jgi:hypothetical protein
MAQVHDVLREFVRHGFRRILVLNWHFENAHFVYEAAFTADQIAYGGPSRRAYPFLTRSQALFQSSSVATSSVRSSGGRA